MTVKLLTEHHLGFLSFKGGCTGLSESTLVKMAQCWKSHVTAQVLKKLGFFSKKLGFFSTGTVSSVSGNCKSLLVQADHTKRKLSIHSTLLSYLKRTMTKMSLCFMLYMAHKVYLWLIKYAYDIVCRTNMAWKMIFREY